MSRKNIITNFVESCNKHPDNTSISVQKRSYTYDSLHRLSASLANVLDKNSKSSEPFLTAILASRSITAYSGIIATLMRGYGYIPLNYQYPPERIAFILKETECRTMIVDAESSKLIPEILNLVDNEMTLLIPDIENIDELTLRFPEHTILCSKDIEDTKYYEIKIPDEDSIAYIIYTSGTTGTPKGVMVAQRNVIHFIDYMVRKFEVTSKDRISQTFNLTFDASVFDIFVAWKAGAGIFCPTQNELLNPSGFIKKNELTIWHSVPSIPIFMKKLGVLKKNSFPTLRYSMFGGEPLPIEVVSSWLEAAPNSEIVNFYGPTETTVSITSYKWDRIKSKEECYRRVVPIGYPYPSSNILICNEKLEEVKPGEIGELLIAGPQVTLGYWKDKEKTEKAFIVPPGKNEIYYRTGDLVRRENHDSPIQYIGRLDSQIKVLGQRVELGEIEAVIREEGNVSVVIALGWPITESGAEAIEVFIEGDNIDTGELKKRIANRLPSYMIPKGIHVIPKIPLNVNGKYDRNALIKILEEQHG